MGKGGTLALGNSRDLRVSSLFLVDMTYLLFRHVDFSYEVSRALAACQVGGESVLLLLLWLQVVIPPKKIETKREREKKNKNRASWIQYMDKGCLLLFFLYFRFLKIDFFP